MKIRALVLALALPLVAYASIEDARQDITQTYDFDPSTMSFDEQADIAPKLSDLWARFDKSPGIYREALRGLLSKEGGREMLYCDGGMLLLKKAVEASDKNLGLRSIEKCSLSEIQHTPYFYTMHRLALSGTDTVGLQLKMLTKPKYQVFVPRHALTLGQDYSFVYPLLVQPEAKYTSAIIARVGKEKDPVALKSLLLALYYSALPDAEAAIRSMVQSKVLPESVKEHAKVIQSRVDEARKTDAAKLWEWIKRNQVAIAENATEKDLRDGRRKRMRSISDEALIELDIYTLLIYQARAKVVH